jgi:hypothetical protein
MHFLHLQVLEYLLDDIGLLLLRLLQSNRYLQKKLLKPM